MARLMDDFWMDVPHTHPKIVFFCYDLFTKDRKFVIIDNYHA